MENGHFLFGIREAWAVDLRKTSILTKTSIVFESLLRILLCRVSTNTYDHLNATCPFTMSLSSTSTLHLVWHLRLRVSYLSLTHPAKCHAVFFEMLPRRHSFRALIPQADSLSPLLFSHPPALLPLEFHPILTFRHVSDHIAMNSSKFLLRRSWALTHTVALPYLP